MLEKYSSKNPAQRVKLTPAVAFASPWHAAAVFFGAGLLRPAPGTWGTAAGILVYAFFSSVVPVWGWCVLAALLFVAGARGADLVARDLGVEDHGGVVADEVVAVWLVALAMPAQTPFWWFAAFVSFRFFDIVKIWPGSLIDRSCKSGWGVMADDLVAAVYAALAVRLAAHFAGAAPLW